MKIQEAGRKGLRIRRKVMGKAGSKKEQRSRRYKERHGCEKGFSGLVASPQNTAGQPVITDFVCKFGGWGGGCMVSAVAGIPRPSAACREGKSHPFLRLGYLTAFQHPTRTRVITSITMKIAKF